MQRRSFPSLTVFLVLGVAGLAACERRGGCTGANCGTIIDAAVAEPGTLLPPSSEDIVANDIGEQLFLKLADVGMSTNTVGDEDFQPLLAQKWEWDGPLTLVFHLDPRARWQDGPRVTAADVEFTFNAYTDSAVGSPFRPKLHRIASVTQRDSLTTVFRFKEKYPEMFYDAVYHMRILPAHLLRPVPRATSGGPRRSVGNPWATDRTGSYTGSRRNRSSWSPIRTSSSAGPRFGDSFGDSPQISRSRSRR